MSNKNDQRIEEQAARVARKAMPSIPEMVEDAARIASAALGIRKALGMLIGNIRETTIETVLSGYYRMLSPSMAPTRGSEFPRTLYSHAKNPDRSSKSGWGNLICFHVGNAILAYYESFLNGKPVDHLFARVEHLREIAEKPHRFIPYGSIETGYCLMTYAAIDALERLHRGLPATTTPEK
jgi:hypothetical protein